MFSVFPILVATSFLLMSDRASFWDPDKESQATEQMVDQNSEESPADFTQFKGKKVLMLVHGYNNRADTAISRYQEINRQVAALLDTEGSPIYDAVIGYLWPGCDNTWEYYSAEKNADELEARMASHLNDLALYSVRVDVLAHSMGNRLVLGALESISSEKKPVQNYYSLAAAVKDDSIEKGHKYYQATQNCHNLYVFHSNHDDVLKFLFLTAEGAEALGYEGEGDMKALSKNIQFIDCTAFVDGHSGYFLAKPLYKFIQNQHTNRTFSSELAPDVKLLENGLIAPISK